MRLFWQNNNLIQENDGELKNISTKMKQSLAELECEEAIIEDKERFGRVRKSMMKYLIVEYGEDVARRAQGRVNKRMKEGYLNQ